MTWIRLDTGRRQHPVVMLLAERLGVRTAEAAGLYDNVLLGFGEHRKDGDASHVTDKTLEAWAAWEGRKGRFARVFREVCVIRKEEEVRDQGDAVGKVKGWMKRQWKLLQKQVADNAKRKPRKSSVPPGGGNGKPPENPRGYPEGFSGKPSVKSGVTPEKTERHGTSKREIPVSDISQLVGETAATLGVRARRRGAPERAPAASETGSLEILH